MFYTLYLKSEKDFSDFKKHSYEELKSLTRSIDIHENSEHQLVMECDAFSVRITNKSQAIQVIGEDYGLELRYLLWFELYYSDEQSTDQRMMKLVGKIIDKNSGPCIMLLNGDIHILKCERDRVVVAGNRKFSAPFHCMDIEYTTGELIQI